MTHMYALVTDQRTAAAETALCEDHFQEEACREQAIRQADNDVIALWEDCSGNDALACIVCGASSIEWD